MKHQTVRLIVATIFVAVLLGLIIGGCAGIPRITHDQCNATKFPTAHEHQLCLDAADAYEQEQHEREDRRLVRLDKMIINLNACAAHDDYGVVEKRHGGFRGCLPTERAQRRAVQEYGVPYTHDNVCKHLSRSDFVCVHMQDFLDQLGRY